MIAELHWRNKIYVIFQVYRRWLKGINITTTRGVTALISTVEEHIKVASSIQEHKTGPLNTAADVTIKFVLDRRE